jgi:NAD+ synthase
MYKFDVKKATDGCIAWIQDWFEKNGKGCNAIIGISGGKDSSVVAALCCKALGKERVFGVLMPDGEQCDIDYSHDLCDFLEIVFAYIWKRQLLISSFLYHILSFQCHYH